MPTKNPRITFTVSEETMKAIEDYKFSHRMKNQTQAILSLIDIGFKVLENKEPIEPAEKLSDEDRQVLNVYHAADPIYQGIALEILESHQVEKKKNRA
jgi:two-component sensor histidine kinase